MKLGKNNQTTKHIYPFRARFSIFSYHALCLFFKSRPEGARPRILPSISLALSREDGRLPLGVMVTEVNSQVRLVEILELPLVSNYLSCCNKLALFIKFHVYS